MPHTNVQNKTAICVRIRNRKISGLISNSTVPNLSKSPPFWSKLVTRSTPGGEEIYQPNLVLFLLFYQLSEGAVIQYQHWWAEGVLQVNILFVFMYSRTCLERPSDSII